LNAISFTADALYPLHEEPEDRNSLGGKARDPPPRSDRLHPADARSLGSIDLLDREAERCPCDPLCDLVPKVNQRPA